MKSCLASGGCKVRAYVHSYFMEGVFACSRVREFFLGKLFSCIVYKPVGLMCLCRNVGS